MFETAYPGRWGRTSPTQWTWRPDWDHYQSAKKKAKKTETAFQTRYTAHIVGHSRILACQNKGFWSKAFGRRSPYSLTISSLSEKGPKIEVAKPKAKASPLTNRETPGTNKIYRRPCLGHTSFVPSSKLTSRLFFPIMACSGGSYQIEQQHIQMPEPLVVCAENHAEKTLQQIG